MFLLLLLGFDRSAFSGTDLGGASLIARGLIDLAGFDFSGFDSCSSSAIVEKPFPPIVSSSGMVSGVSAPFGVPLGVSFGVSGGVAPLLDELEPRRFAFFSSRDFL